MITFSAIGLYEFPFVYQKLNTFSYPWMCLQSLETKQFVLALSSVAQ